MENDIKNASYYENLSLEEAIKERETCFNEKGELINQDKLYAVLHNAKLFSYLFSDENLLKNAQQERDLSVKAAGETFLNKAYPPSWYWEMPDYYYPGLYSENKQEPHNKKDIDKIFDKKSDSGKIRQTTTRNEAVLNDCGWEQQKYGSQEYYNDDFPNLKLVFKKDSDIVYFANIDLDTKKELSRFEIPFSLLCGMFLKCRELEFKKPWQLRAHDYQYNFPRLFEKTHKIVRDPETHEIIDYGDWKPEE